MDYDELPREEVLVRLYELQAQLEVFNTLRWLDAEERGVRGCQDCGRQRPVRRLDRVVVCESCGLTRIRVAALTEASSLATDCA